jgi:hypothetical protein
VPWEGARPRSACGPDVAGDGRPRRGTRGRAGAATSRRGLVPAQRFQTRLLRARFFPNFGTEVHQAVNSKVVDLTALYNFYKGSRVFFSMDFA